MNETRARRRAAAPTTIYDDGLPTPRRYWSIVAMAMAVMLAVLGGTMANVALPTIAEELEANPATSIWIVNAYQIAVVIALLPLSSLGEIVGFRRISEGGLLLFGVASLACALAPTLPTLIVARVFQGIGAAGLMSVNGALVRFTYPNKQLGRAIAVTALVGSLAFAAGPTIASAILAVASWRWLFGVNVPLALIAVVIALRSLPHSPLQGTEPKWSSIALHAVTFGLLIAGLQAFSSIDTYLLATCALIGATMLGVVFVRHELRHATPLLPFDLLRIPIFSLSLLTSICCFSAQMLALVSLPFDLQVRLGYSAVETGLLLTPWPLAVAAAAPIVARLSDRWPAAILGGIGLMVMALAMVSLASLPPQPEYGQVAWRMALCGFGFGLFQTPNNRILLGVAPRERAGAAGGMLGTARLVGQSLGAVGVALCFHFFSSAPTISCLIAGAVAAGAAALVSFARLSNDYPVAR